MASAFAIAITITSIAITVNIIIPITITFPQNSRVWGPLLEKGNTACWNAEATLNEWHADWSWGPAGLDGGPQPNRWHAWELGARRMGWVAAGPDWGHGAGDLRN